MKKPHIDISPEDGLEWEGGGYVHRVQSLAGAPIPESVAADPLAAFGSILEGVKSGDFRDVERLFDVRDAVSETDTRLAALATILLGDAGTSRVYGRFGDEIRADPDNYEIVIDACDALSMRGLLADVPVMLLGYRNTVYGIQT